MPQFLKDATYKMLTGLQSAITSILPEGTDLQALIDEEGSLKNALVTALAPEPSTEISEEQATAAVASFLAASDIEIAEGQTNEAALTAALDAAKAEGTGTPEEPSLKVVAFEDGLKAVGIEPKAEEGKDLDAAAVTKAVKDHVESTASARATELLGEAGHDSEGLVPAKGEEPGKGTEGLHGRALLDAATQSKYPEIFGKN